MRAIAVDREGSYWFGGGFGLAYYEPETSMPWVRLDQMSGANWNRTALRMAGLCRGALRTQFSFGDLQTNQDKIAVFVRSVENGQPEAWVQASDGEYRLTLAQPGHYTFEFRRDQAFNISPVTAVDVTAIPVPAMISVPLLGEVEVRIFQLLVLFGSLAIFGFGYVSFEIVQHRRRIVAAVERLQPVHQRRAGAPSGHVLRPPRPLAQNCLDAATTAS